MRDSERIDEIVMEVLEVWKEMPDLRLTQLLRVAASKAGWSSDDLFYLEDSKLLQGLRKLKSSKD